MKKFEITNDEWDKIQVWNKSHSCINDNIAIGGKLTISFTPTSIGTFIEVNCICGEKN